MKFSEKLMNLRKQKGMSQEELADKLNVTRQTISKWELDQTVPDMNKLIEISKLFEISLDELTGEIKMNEYQNEYTNEYKETSHEKKNTKIALKVFIVGTIISLIICGIGLFKQISANNTNEKSKQEALKLSEQKVEQAKIKLQEIETQYNEAKTQYEELKNQYENKQNECIELNNNMQDTDWFKKISKCRNEESELQSKMIESKTKTSNLESEYLSIKNADYTVYYSLVDKSTYTIFYWIGLGTFGGFILISLIFYLATRKK